MHPALAEFARTRSADAFREVVAQHVDAVYAQCLRRLDDPAAAEDATQAVFVTLAQKAPTLAAGTVLGGWLYVTAQNVCHNARRAQVRRQHHERKAAQMRPEVRPADTGPQWRDVRAVLDDAIAGLGAGLRDAVVLRFLEGRSMAEVATTLGLSEEAARQRVSRAVRALREQLAGRGVAVPAVLLPGLLEANAKLPAPPALVESATAHALAAPATVATGASLGQVAAVAAVVVAGTAAVSAFVFAGQVSAPSAAKPQAAAPAPKQVVHLADGVDAPPELVGTWRLTTKDELIPRADGKRVRLMPVVIRGREITIESRGLDADAPTKRLVFRVLATRLDGEQKGLDALLVDMTRDGEPQPERAAEVHPMTWRIDADGLLHLTAGDAGGEPPLVLQRDDPATQAAAEVPAELVGTWRLTTPDELIPRNDGKRLRLLPLVIGKQDIEIETRGEGPVPSRRIELRVVATAKRDDGWHGLDAVVTEMIRDGRPQAGVVGNLVPARYRLDAEGLLHLHIEEPELVLRREEATTQP